MRAHLSRLRTCRNGAVAIIFGLVAFVLAISIGLAIDYSRMATERTKIDAAADAASLAGLKMATQLAAQGGSGAINVSAISAAAQREARRVFDTATVTIRAQSKISPKFTLTYDPVTTLWTSTVTYNAKVASTFASLVGKTELNISGTAVAAAAVGSVVYVDVQMLLDVSSSMGIGATSGDISTMIALNGCAFGCHVGASKATYYDLPRANGVKMRIDVLRESTQNLIAAAKTAANGLGNIRFAVDTFNDKVTSVVAMTSDLDSASASVGGVDLPTYDDATDLKGALLNANAKMSTSGDGAIMANPKKFLFLVTDGVEDQIYMTTANTFDTPDPAGAWKNTGSMNPAVCNAIKAKGITLAVIYTRYVKFDGWQYTDLIQPFEDKIPKNLEKCSSNGFYLEATSASEIDAAMQTMFKKSIAATKSRLTN